MSKREGGAVAARRQPSFSPELFRSKGLNAWVFLDEVMGEEGDIADSGIWNIPPVAPPVQDSGDVMHLSGGFDENDPNLSELERQTLKLLRLQGKTEGQLAVALQELQDYKSLFLTLARPYAASLLGNPVEMLFGRLTNIESQNKDNRNGQQMYYSARLMKARLALRFGEEDVAMKILERTAKHFLHWRMPEYYGAVQGVIADMHFSKKDYAKGFEVLEKIIQYPWCEEYHSVAKAYIARMGRAQQHL